MGEKSISQHDRFIRTRANVLEDDDQTDLAEELKLSHLNDDEDDECQETIPVSLEKSQNDDIQERLKELSEKVYSNHVKEMTPSQMFKERMRARFGEK